MLLSSMHGTDWRVRSGRRGLKRQWAAFNVSCPLPLRGMALADLNQRQDMASPSRQETLGSRIIPGLFLSRCAFFAFFLMPELPVGLHRRAGLSSDRANCRRQTFATANRPDLLVRRVNRPNSKPWPALPFCDLQNGFREKSRGFCSQVAPKLSGRLFISGLEGQRDGL